MTKKEPNDGTYDDDKKIEEKAIHILLDCLNNISAVHYKSKDYCKAKEAATAVLQWDVTNQKALCRAAKAALLDPAGSFEESEMAILAAEKLYPNESQVQSLRKFLIQKKKQHKEREKAMYGGKIILSSKKNTTSPEKEASTHNNNDNPVEENDTNNVNKATHSSDMESEETKYFGISRIHLFSSMIIMVVITWFLKKYI